VCFPVMPNRNSNGAPLTPKRNPPSLLSKGKRGAGRRGAVQDDVLAKLRNGLMIGALLPGQIMSLRKVASSLGTSPMPVRAALMQLVAAGALEELPNRSVRVPRLTKTRLEELFRIRELLEGMAAKMACENATPKLIERLSKINDELLVAIARRDIQSCLKTNQTFHFTLYDASNAEVLLPLIESLWLQCGPTMYFSLLSPQMPWDASAHGDILAGLRKRKPNLVQVALVRDVRTTANNLLSRAPTGDIHDVLSAPLMDAYF